MNNDYVTKDSGRREEFGTGAVRDVRSGKGRYDLISFLALHRVAGVYERGAAKYSDRNWEAGIPISRNIDSALRHVGQFMVGEGDEDHLAQAAWNLLAALHFHEGIERGIYPPELDDRPEYATPENHEAVAEAQAEEEEDEPSWMELVDRTVPDIAGRDLAGPYAAEDAIVHPYTPDMSEHSEGQDHLGMEYHEHEMHGMLHSHDMEHRIVIDRSA